jgi:hypothetical protein
LDGHVRCINCDELLALPQVAAHRCGTGNSGSGGLSLKGMASRGLSLFGNKTG